MTRILSAIVVAVMLAIVPPSPVHAQSPDEDDTPPSRGEYLLEVSGCIHCHTADDGERLAGGHALETPFGTFYTPNITPHQTAGIGAWSEDDLRRALRHGEAPDGSDYYPSFPYTSYTRMRDDDIAELYAYLMSLPASERPNREHDLAWFLQWRIAAQAWKWLFFEAGEFDRSSERGAYIAEALGHCQECHTPRNLFGALRTDMAYAGNADGPEGDLVPNITSHDSGIGDWSRESLETFLRFGELPNGEYTAGSMDPVIQGISKLTQADRDALIDYLRALPPIDNRVRK